MAYLHLVNHRQIKPVQFAHANETGCLHFYHRLKKNASEFGIYLSKSNGILSAAVYIPGKLFTRVLVEV